MITQEAGPPLARVPGAMPGARGRASCGGRRRSFFPSVRFSCAGTPTPRLPARRGAVNPAPRWLASGRDPAPTRGEARAPQTAGPGRQGRGAQRATRAKLGGRCTPTRQRPVQAASPRRGPRRPARTGPHWFAHLVLLSAPAGPDEARRAQTTSGATTNGMGTRMALQLRGAWLAALDVWGGTGAFALESRARRRRRPEAVTSEAQPTDPTTPRRNRVESASTCSSRLDAASLMRGDGGGPRL